MTPTNSTEELARQWDNFVRTGKLKYLPNPYDVAVNNLRDSLNRIYEKIGA